MNRDPVRLLSVTALESRSFRKGGRAPLPVPDGTRLKRRAAVDLSVDEELVRGALRGEALPAPLRRDLALLVDQELTQGAPLEESRFVSAGLRRGVFALRRRRRLEALIAMNLVRRESTTVRPTVAGIAAARQTSDAETPASRELLRSLRLAEIGSIRPA